jgi:hypothetical protein
MSKLRDEIAEIIQTIDEPWLAADDIMTAVREALMGNEAVDAAVDRYWSADPDVPRDYGDMERAITAALDAATGKGGER